MKLTYPDYYLAFRCSASGCEDNCCIGWEIDIDERAYADYMARGGVFGQRLRGSIAQGEAPHFLLQEERCPFLNEQNLCDIILNLGESALCEICTQHPRFHEWFGDIKAVSYTHLYNAEAEEGFQGFTTISVTEGTHPYVYAWWPAGHVYGYEHTMVHEVFEFVQAIAHDKPASPDFNDGLKRCV